MVDYGLIVSQKCYDCKVCADRFIAYSSAFEGLKIFSKTAVTISGGASYTITHNLGYYAPFIVFKSDGSIFQDCRQSVNTLILNYDGDLDSGVLKVFIFANDFSSLTGVNINSGTTLGDSEEDYGLRVSKEGYDVMTCTDDQLMFSSSFYTNIIHTKGSISPTDGGGGYATAPASVSHGLGYVADYFCYKRENAESFITLWLSSTDYNISAINSSALLVAGVLDPSLPQYKIDQTFYYIIFKNRTN